MKFVTWPNETPEGRLNFFAAARDKTTIYMASDIHESVLFAIAQDVFKTDAKQGVFHGVASDVHWRHGAVNDRNNIYEASNTPGWADEYLFDDHTHIEIQIADRNQLFPGDDGYVKEYGPKRPGMV